MELPEATVGGAELLVSGSRHSPRASSVYGQKSSDTVCIGVPTPGCITLRRGYNRKDDDWVALCVSVRGGTSMDVVRAGGNGGTRLGQLGMGHHNIKCFVAVRAAWPRGARHCIHTSLRRRRADRAPLRCSPVE
jgi:hypothetical protein